MIPRVPGTARLLAALGGLAVAVWLLTAPGASRAAELVMFDSATCPWCAAWNRDVGDIYPKTEEGRRAPLRRVDIHAPRPADLRHIEGVVYTPTFVLMEGGQEVGRIVGYSGEDHFWGLLGELIGDLSPGAGSQTGPNS